MTKKHWSWPHYVAKMNNDVSYSVGLDMRMRYEWITSAYHDRRCTGRFRGSRGVQVVRVQTGGALSTRTCQGWESPGLKQRWQLKTDQNGFKVWANAPTWMRFESRSRSRSKKFRKVSSECVIDSRKRKQYKKAVLSQRWPRDARYISR